MVTKNNAKMHRTNSTVKKWLEANSFNDYYLFQHTRFSKDLHITWDENDIEFDGMARFKNKIVLFQNKTNRKASKALIEKYNEASERFGILCLYFNKIDRKGLFINNQPSETFLINQDL